jgi:hypothetical protein
MRTFVGITLGLLLLAAASAHADDVVLPLPPEDRQKINKELGMSVVGQALPGKPIEDVSVYFPLEEKAENYQVTAGPNVGKTQTLGLAKTKRPGGKPAWRFQFSPSLAGFIHQTPQGDLIVSAVTDTGEGVVVITTPANPFVLKGMKLGDTRSYSQQVSVIELDNPADQDHYTAPTLTWAPTR